MHKKFSGFSENQGKAGSLEVISFERTTKGINTDKTGDENLPFHSGKDEHTECPSLIVPVLSKYD